MSRTSNFPNEVNNRLIWSVDLQDIESVKTCLSLNPSLAAVDHSFQLAVSSRNLALMDLFRKHSLKPSGKLVHDLLLMHANQCVYPEIVGLLQDLAQPIQVAELHRHFEELKRCRELDESGFYLVDLCEASLIKEVAAKQMQFGKPTRSISRSNRLLILTQQNWINDFFLDVTKSHRKSVLNYLLNKGNAIKPSQSTINAAFSLSIENYNFSTASMLMLATDLGGVESKLSIDQAGLDEIVLESADFCDDVALEWLMTGRYGWRPTQAAVDEAFERTYNALHYSPQYSRRNSRRSEAVMAILGSRVTKAKLDEIERERRRREKIQRINAGVRHVFREEFLDIHAYSRIAVPSNSIEVGNNSESQINGASASAGAVGGGGVNSDEDDDEDDDEDEEINRRPIRREASNRQVQPNKRTKLNEAILAHIDTRVPKKEGGYDNTEVTNRLLELIDEHIPENQRAEGERIIGDVLNSRSVNIFGKTLAFLDSLYEDKASRDQLLMNWIQGFLSESIVMHSCIPGALERVVTGLRGIGDAQLNRIFGQAEGPHLVNIFLKANFNVFYDPGDLNAKALAEKHAKNLAHQLTIRGVKEDSSEEDVRAILVRYALDAISDFGVLIDERYKAEVDAVVDIVTDNYETHLKPFVMTILAANEQ